MAPKLATRSSSVPAPASRVYRPNALLRWVYHRFFRHIEVDAQWKEAVESAASRGTVVYVMRSLSFLDFLCLDFLVKQLALPLIRFVNDLGLWILEPFGRGERRLRFRRQIPEDEALTQVVRERHAALLFLRKRPKIGRAARKGGDLEVDLIRTLVEAQRRVDEPILLVPQTFVWSKLPPRRKRGLLDLIFGPVEWPGRVRVMFQFMRNFRNALLRAGEPFDLAAFLEEHQDLTDDQVADKVRYLLLRRMERERTLVLGPTKKTPGRIRDELLRSPRVRKAIASQARGTNKPVWKVERVARKELRKLCANQNPHLLGYAQRLFEWVWNRMYDGLVVDAEGVERVRNAAREGAIILLPSHKSHVDYLILSYVLYVNALSPPLIAAGENLSFWPLGPLLRRGGAFFIRRSFKGQKLYSALVDAYVRKLIVEGFAIELFLEGGRSRTGKLLAPKFGLLSMLVDAALLLRTKKVRFVPVSIGYERIIEQTSYVHELSGGDKQKENIADLLRTPRVLRSKYGRLYVQFGEILRFEDALAEVTGDDDAGLSPKARRTLIQRIGRGVIHEIDRATVVTPAALVATALLVHRRRGMPHAELQRTCEALLSTLERDGARAATPLRDADGGIRADVVAEAVSLFVDAKLVVAHETGDETIYTIPEERRIALEYYKNNIAHFFVPRALIAVALLSGDREPPTDGALRERVRQLAQLLSHELTFADEAGFEREHDRTVAAMLDGGELERLADRLRIGAGGPGKRLPRYATMLRSYFEAYLLALRTASELVDGPMSAKDWSRRALALGQRMYLAGEIELRESMSKLKLDNALASLRDHGLVRYASMGDLAAGEDVDRADFRELERKLSGFLR